MTRATTQAVRHWATQTPDAPAVRWQGQVLTYRQIATEIAACAALLTRSGLRPGMWAGLQSDDRLLHMILILACESVGAATMSLSVHDLVSDAGLCRSLHLICHDDGVSLPPVEGQIRLTPAQVRADLQGHQQAGWEALEAAWPPETLARIVRTSGTTGAPKLVPVRLGEIAERRATQLHSTLRVETCRTWLALYNFTFGAAYHLMCNAFETGGTLLFHDLDSFVAGFDDLPPFVANLLAAEASWLAERCAGLGKRPRRGSFVIGGGALPQALRDVLTVHVVTEVQNVYSSHESGRIAVVAPDGVGDLVPGAQCRILDEHDREQPLGEPGIIAIRSTTTFSGYLGEPAAGGIRTVDGWVVTSDYGLMPAPGRLQVLGRRDDMLNIAGTKVAPQPFEERLRTLPGVRDAVLLSVPDGLGIGRLLIVLEVPDANQTKIDPERVAALLPLHLGEIELIRVTAFPRTATGKVQKKEIRDWWLAQRNPSRS